MTVIEHRAKTVRRRLARALAAFPGVLVLAASVPAFAAPPEQWAEADAVSPLGYLLVLVLIPAGLFVLIALLVSLGSSGRDGSTYQPGLAWRHEPEWFGGPRDGVEKAERTSPRALEGAEGGASGRW